MRHRMAGRHLARTSAHNIAMRRNLAQSLFEHGEIETTLIKAKEVRRFVEKLITLARRGDARSRQRVTALLNDRAVIPAAEQEKYEGMSSAHREKVLFARTGRRHRAGKVPAAYNKKKIPFVAGSVVEKLMSEIAPRFAKDTNGGPRPGGYTRIIRLPKRRIGDAGMLAILQLVGTEEPGGSGVRKMTGRRKTRTEARKRALKSGFKRKEKATAAAAPKADTPQAE